MIPAACGPIHRLAWAVTDTEAAALIEEAKARGATDEQAATALALWRRLRADDVITIHTTGGTR